MDAANSQKILGYFIEEAKEHLVTLERGLLELASVIKDSERINEMFRAAHSIKGGAAMLGYESIQKTAHHLEDAFKILQEEDVTPDQNLEALFFDGYDVLQDLIELLQSPSGLQEEEGTAIIQKAEPKFNELQNYLSQSLGQESQGADEAQVPPVYRKLRQMLVLFRQPSTPQTRQQLQDLCGQLTEETDNEAWQTLVTTAQQAIANPKYAYSLLAPVVITDLKRGTDSLELGHEITPSPGLQKLAVAQQPQILVTVEPQAAATALKQAFNPQQLTQIAALLSHSDP
ncbi:MAG: Hpt domain-containing protein [Cyanophyceae cyanobacterium]